MSLTLKKIHMNTKTVLACTSVVVAFALIVEPLAVLKEAFTVKSSNPKQSASTMITKHSKSKSVGGYSL